MSDATSSARTGDDIQREQQLAAIRAGIDAIDGKLLKLINERSRLSLEVGRIKASGKSAVFKPQRKKKSWNA